MASIAPERRPPGSGNEDGEDGEDGEEDDAEDGEDDATASAPLAATSEIFEKAAFFPMPRKEPS